MTTEPARAPWLLGRIGHGLVEDRSSIPLPLVAGGWDRRADPASRS